MKHYHIERTAHGVTLMLVDGAKTKTISPHRSQTIANHSPDGFEFGYGGSGPAQLALAILLDHTDDKRIALPLYQNFKFAFIGAQRGQAFTIQADDINNWIIEQHTKKERSKENDPIAK